MIYAQSLMRKKRFITLDELTAEDVNIHDIAYALSNIARFCGQLPFYSVAKHSINVARLVPEELKISALLHDASEAYIGDVITPVKKNLPDYRELEHRIMNLIAVKFKIVLDHPVIKQADTLCLQLEKEELIPQMSEFRTESQSLTYNEFLGAFYDYQ